MSYEGSFTKNNVCLCLSWPIVCAWINLPLFQNILILHFHYYFYCWCCHYYIDASQLFFFSSSSYFCSLIYVAHFTVNAFLKEEKTYLCHQLWSSMFQFSSSLCTFTAVCCSVCFQLMVSTTLLLLHDFPVPSFLKPSITSSSPLILDSFYFSLLNLLSGTEMSEDMGPQRVLN